MRRRLCWKKCYAQTPIWDGTFLQAVIFRQILKASYGQKNIEQTLQKPNWVKITPCLVKKWYLVKNTEKIYLSLEKEKQAH